MKVFALGDLHLSFGLPDKSMEYFGPVWQGYIEKIETRWRDLVSEEDLILLPGDLSWALSLEGALVDLQWIDALPGIKVMIKGNHDYWWGSLNKLYKSLPKSLHPIQNNSFTHKNITIGGSRLWDSEEIDFTPFIAYTENPRENKKEEKVQNDLQEKILDRELIRLRLSLDQLDPKASLRICMTHYPPTDFSMKPTKITKILEEYKIDIAVFGHLHSVKPSAPKFGSIRGVEYVLTSCDLVDFTPVLIREL